MIASNIANADTPGYQAADIDIEEAMRIVRFMYQFSVDWVSGHFKMLMELYQSSLK